MFMKVTISLDNELHAKAKEYARRTGRTLSGLVQLCLVKWMRKDEDMSKWERKE